MQSLLVLLFLGRRGNEGSINVVCVCIAQGVLVVSMEMVHSLSIIHTGSPGTPSVRSAPGDR
jgi:hypothetical protein